MQSMEDALDLIEVRTFMACQSIRVGHQCLLERFSRPDQRIRTCPVLRLQRLQYRQEPLALLGKGTQRGLKVLFEIVGILDPCARVESLDRWIIFGKDCHNIVAAPDLITGAQVSEHFVGGPFTYTGGGLQLKGCQPGGERFQARRSFFQYRQNRLDREIF